ncbi:MAG: hypothetical protein ACP5QO_14370 [Clostridia bacterium]|jgi:hypothetical protein
MSIFGWVFGLGTMAIGVWLYRYPSRYGRGFVQALSLVIMLGGVYIIWVTHMLAGHSALHHAIF